MLTILINDFLNKNIKYNIIIKIFEKKKKKKKIFIFIFKIFMFLVLIKF